MGWSCRADAAKTMDKWAKACTAQTGKSNSYKVGDVEFFFEASNREHSDGAITGAVFKMVSQTQCFPAGSFRIEPDGFVSRAPAFLKKVS